MNTLKVGGEVDAVCTRCKMTLAHTILAMVGQKPVRVQCNTCHGQHNYRGAEGSSPARSPSSSAGTSRPRSSEPRESTRAVRVSFDELLAQHQGIPKPYSPKTAYLMDELIDHPTFGRGFVSSVRADKIDVIFRGGTKTLVHAKR